ncbi:MAG: SPOR domain-containing protein [Spirochaetia bacterium]
MRVFTAPTEKLFVVLLALCLCAAAAFAQQNWQGNAAIARRGEFSTPGLFAASNAFPENTPILVRNPQSGQSVQVTVAQRIPGAGSIFLLLSEEAGTQIGLTGSEVIRVRANVVSSLGKGLSESLQEDAYSADPDLNPPISIAEEQLPAGPETTSEEQVQPEAPVEVAQEPTPDQVESIDSEETAESVGEQAAGPEVAEQPAEEEEVVEAEAPAAPKEIEKTPEEKRLEELADRIPQKQLYMPPRQQEIYALAPEPSEAEEIEEEIAEVVVEETPEEPPAEEEIAEVVVEEAAEEAVIEPEAPQVSMLVPPEEQEDLDVALPGPEAVEPEKPSPEGSRLPVPEEESPLTMEPEEPPFTAEDIEVAEVVEPLVEEEEPVAEIAMAESPPTPEEQMILSEILPSSSYFVQLGAYSTRGLAEKLAGNFTQTYSVTILPASSGGRQFYKVLVGPLNVDESGTLLYQFRSRGFKDAFIQYVE